MSFERGAGEGVGVGGAVGAEFRGSGFDSEPRGFLLAVNSTFQLLGSYKVVDSESFNLYFLGFWASE